MTTQEIVQKLWSLCDVLRDDGVTYHQYVTELTYILFLKMAKETGAEKNIPEGYRWDNLLSKQGVELKRFYQDLLKHLGEEGKGRIKEIYANYPDIETQIIVASVRNPIHVIEAAMLGAEIVTIPPAIIEQMVKHPLTDKGIAQFLEDAKKIGTKR